MLEVCQSVVGCGMGAHTLASEAEGRLILESDRTVPRCRMCHARSTEVRKRATKAPYTGPPHTPRTAGPGPAGRPGPPRHSCTRGRAAVEPPCITDFYDRERHIYIPRRDFRGEKCTHTRLRSRAALVQCNCSCCSLSHILLLLWSLSNPVMAAQEHTAHGLLELRRIAISVPAALGLAPR